MPEAARWPVRMKVHESIKWGLLATTISAGYLPHRDKSGSRFTFEITEAAIRVFVAALLETIELDIKARLQRFLRRTRGIDWWNTLPARVQQNARNRHRWTSAELGPRRTYAYPNLAWLTMGDGVNPIVS
jgi:hypothetical protein